MALPGEMSITALPVVGRKVWRNLVLTRMAMPALCGVSWDQKAVKFSGGVQAAADDGVECVSCKRSMSVLLHSWLRRVRFVCCLWGS